MEAGRAGSNSLECHTLDYRVIAAERLLTAWTCRQSVVSMIVDLPSMADALTAGAQMARVLGSGDGLASVTAKPIAAVHQAD